MRAAKSRESQLRQEGMTGQRAGRAAIAAVAGVKSKKQKKKSHKKCATPYCNSLLSHRIALLHTFTVNVEIFDATGPP